MIRNAFLKNLLMGTVFRGVSLTNRLMPKRDKQILLYSDLGFRDNVKYLYDYLIENNYQKYYQIYCATKDYQKWQATAPQNVHFVSPVQGVFRYMTSCHIFYCFGKLPIVPTKKQIAIQMWHGTSFKGFAQNMTKTASHTASYYTYVYASSDYFVPIVAKKFNCSLDQVAICGHPRTDVFYQPTKQYNLGNFKKTIIWLPTFRHSKALGQADSSRASVLPFIADDKLEQFDHYLSKQNVQIIVKLHPMQDLTGIDTTKLTNLKLFSNQDFENSGMDLYRLLKLTDALITDYSSVFYDYLLLNKPIGFTEDDVEEYQRNRGFAVDPDKFRPGKRIKTLSELKDFVSMIAQNQDQYESQRLEINNIANKYQDGSNCKRSLQLSRISL